MEYVGLQDSWTANRKRSKTSAHRGILCSFRFISDRGRDLGPELNVGRANGTQTIVSLGRDLAGRHAENPIILVFARRVLFLTLRGSDPDLDAPLGQFHTGLADVFSALPKVSFSGS